jgi:Na+-transporting NADH:ubiquinone oxidoreductase subunit NqrF
LPEDGWNGHVGVLQEVIHEAYLRTHPNPRAVEYYLCGPPGLIKACTKILVDLGVSANQIAYDEF